MEQMQMRIACYQAVSVPSRPVSSKEAYIPIITRTSSSSWAWPTGCQCGEARLARYNVPTVSLSVGSVDIYGWLSQHVLEKPKPKVIPLGPACNVGRQAVSKYNSVYDMQIHRKREEFFSHLRTTGGHPSAQATRKRCNSTVMGDQSRVKLIGMAA
ncbi:hypothetical protein BAUCODRAFT_121615 [Baudoinia panamericana UAMH 10762]|uniref:Uncharacterized protein n=1 Tax=Baudoinia panamericana (strain UAMH 10762) TaxID=717646 RepID=M2LRM6_BAUPA|nr:uncharacterized protein BAUCODRAFT_121615 [Baudoinia panamericana UAMH 10762]EMC97107.1 hypothetical protein BAUCODRAFT_121615 [Baudoinia panamericana UAMH 10762]